MSRVDEGGRRGVDGLDIQEAARRLGISEGAVRKRVARGTIEHHKDADGRVYVYLDAGVDAGVDPDSGALISRLEDEVAFLREQVLRHQEIIAQQAVTMRQLTAAPPEYPSGEREDRETVEEEPERSEQPRSAAGAAQEGARRPWWRRVLGG
jgi:Sigma-70, region 4